MKSNPLATRYVAPGRIPWQPIRGQSLQVIYDRLARRFQFRAAIVGPHGSGKSTLLEHLVPLIGPVVLRQSTYGQHAESLSGDCDTAPSGRAVVWLKLRGQHLSRRLVLQTRSYWARADSILVIDGYEQLGRGTRGLVLALSWLRGAGLLITSHRPTWLPTLIETDVEVSLAQRLLESLLPDDAFDDQARQRLLDAERLRQLLGKHQGSLREVFMELYDELQ